jgi:CDP-glycerol glycerophosphotransferase (TagB/SpsB family)
MKRILLAMARVVAGLPLNIVYLLASLVPKDRKLWLFSAWNGRRYSDNPKYIYKYLLAHRTDIKAIWITRDKKLHRAMQNESLPVALAFSLAGICYQLRAGAVVFTHSVDWDFAAAFVGSQAKRVQTWHGMPMKKIGFDDTKDRNSRLKAKLNSWLLPFKNERFDLVVSGSAADKAKYQTAFDVDPENISVTGYPRNDEIVRTISRKAAAETKRIIYMPTFRGTVGSEFQLLQASGLDYPRADSILKEIGAELYIKLHPVQVFSKDDLDAINRSANIKAVFNDDDIYEQIGEYDILITDFSGIYFDFLITGKPIIMAPFDLGKYTSMDRELYYSYDEICPDPPCLTWDAVFSRICELVAGDEARTSRYARLQARFHKYRDANSSERVVNEIERLVGLVSDRDARIQATGH